MVAVIAGCFMLLGCNNAHALGTRYLYHLSDFNGVVLYNSPGVAIDTERSEAYLLYGSSVRVFTESGMEIYRFRIGLDGERLMDLAVNKQGDMLALVYKGNEYRIQRCDYRGEPKQSSPVSGLPDEFKPFLPNKIVHREGRLYLVDSNAMRIVVTDEQGVFIKGYDIPSLLGLGKDERDCELGGFSVDREGYMLFTIPVLFRAFRLSPDNTVAAFGQPGSSPGKFNIAGGIARDSHGNYLVSDVVKCSVMVFDSAFKYVMQFGSGKKRMNNCLLPGIFP